MAVNKSNFEICLVLSIIRAIVDHFVDEFWLQVEEDKIIIDARLQTEFWNRKMTEIQAAFPNLTCLKQLYFELLDDGFNKEN